MRRGRLGTLAAGVVATTLILACSSFSASDPSPTDDAGEASSERDGRGPPSDAADDPVTPSFCLATPGPDAGTTLGPTACPGGTFDIATNAEHCGACNYACAKNKACTNGRCTSEVVATTFPAIYPVMGKVTSAGVFMVRNADPDAGETVAQLERHALLTNAVDLRTPLTTTSAGIASDELGTYVADYNGALVAMNAAGVVAFRHLPKDGLTVGPHLAARHGRVTFVDPFARVLRSFDETGAATTFKATVGAITSLAVDDGSAYWLTPDDGGSTATLESVTFSAGNIKTTSLDHTPNALAVDDAYLYYYATGARELRRIVKDLSAPPERLGTWTGTDGREADFLALNGDYLYALLVLPSDNVLVRMPRCGGVVQALAPEPGSGFSINTAGRLEFDDTYVYYVTNVGDVRRVPR